MLDHRGSFTDNCTSFSLPPTADSILTKVYGCFCGSKVNKPEANHPPPSSEEMKNEWSFIASPPYVKLARGYLRCNNLLLQFLKSNYNQRRSKGGGRCEWCHCLKRLGPKFGKVTDKVDIRKYDLPRSTSFKLLSKMSGTTKSNK